MMESWRKVLREGFFPLVSTLALKATLDALKKDDPRLLQGATLQPPPLQCMQDWPVEAACLVCYGGWQGDGLELVGETEEYFTRMCFEIDNRVGEPGGCRWLLNAYDEWSRNEMRTNLIPEFQAELANRMYPNICRPWTPEA
jgi:hypothetical protein